MPPPVHGTPPVDTAQRGEGMRHVGSWNEQRRDLCACTFRILRRGDQRDTCGRVDNRARVGGGIDITRTATIPAHRRSSGPKRPALFYYKQLRLLDCFWSEWQGLAPACRGRLGYWNHHDAVVMGLLVK